MSSDQVPTVDREVYGSEIVEWIEQIMKIIIAILDSAIQSGF